MSNGSNYNTRLKWLRSIAELEPRAAGMQVRRSDYSAKLPPSPARFQVFVSLIVP